MRIRRMLAKFDVASTGEPFPVTWSCTAVTPVGHLMLKMQTVYLRHLEFGSPPLHEMKLAEHMIASTGPWSNWRSWIRALAAVATFHAT